MRLVFELWKYYRKKCLNVHIVGRYTSIRATCGRCSTATTFYLSEHLPSSQDVDGPVVRGKLVNSFQYMNLLWAGKSWLAPSRRRGYLGIYLGTSTDDAHHEMA